MHELVRHVLSERDLTRAGDLFAIPDADIVDDLNQVIKQITEISSRADYCRNDRDQALIEICVTRVTSCIKETGTLDKYSGALVALLETCLHHNLMPLGHLRDDDPPHAKIASDIIACIVLVSFPVQSDKEKYCNKSVMELFLPIAVQFLHKGNREISRHMARYLSLAAVHHALLLKPHVHTIMDSIMSGNYPLCSILTNLYSVCPEPLEGHTTALVALLPHAEPQEKTSLFRLLEQVAQRRAEALRTCIPQLLSHLCAHSAAAHSHPGCMCTDILQLMVVVARSSWSLALPHSAAVRRAGAVRGGGGEEGGGGGRQRQLVAAFLTQLGLASRDRAQEALNFIVESLPLADVTSHAALVRDACALCSAYPALFTEQVTSAVRHTNSRPKPPAPLSAEVNRTTGGVTIVKLTGPSPPTPAVTPAVTPAGYTRRAKLGDSRSTGRLHSGPNTQRSTTRLNVGGSVGGLHKSMTRLSSSQQITVNSAAGGGGGGGGGGGKQPSVNGAASSGSVSGGGGATTPGGGGRRRGGRGPHHHHIVIGPPPGHTTNTPVAVPVPPPHKSAESLAGAPSAVSVQHSALGHVSVTTPPAPSANPAPSPLSAPYASAVTTRRNNTSVTLITSGGESGPGATSPTPTPAPTTNTTSTNRMSVFEPYPLRDTVQHFCEKHLEKIRAYMDHVSLRLPPPAKCTIEERRSKKLARLQFACGRRGPHCLYARTLFSMRTRAPRVWIHLMFLALQARHPSALSSRDPTVASLKHCWDTLRSENKTFLTLVTSAFPGVKEQELVLSELRAAGFFAVFSLESVPQCSPTQATWGCFLCAHPERAGGFLAADGAPVIEGQLKEKKGRWRLFRRWRTRYFTLSGAHLSCKGPSGGGGESIDINQIRSVKVSRGARNIPKAFEIFTGDQTLILKPNDGKNAEEWVQCLSIAVARSQARAPQAKANSLPARGL